MCVYICVCVYSPARSSLAWISHWSSAGLPSGQWGQRLREGSGCSNLLISLIPRPVGALSTRCREQKDGVNSWWPWLLCTAQCLQTHTWPCIHSHVNLKFCFHQYTLLRWDKIETQRQVRVSKKKNTATVPSGPKTLKRLHKTLPGRFALLISQRTAGPNMDLSAVPISLSQFALLAHSSGCQHVSMCCHGKYNLASVDYTVCFILLWSHSTFRI